jgi:hypothetical protein
MITLHNSLNPVSGGGCIGLTGDPAEIVTTKSAATTGWSDCFREGAVNLPSQSPASAYTGSIGSTAYNNYQDGDSDIWCKSVTGGYQCRCRVLTNYEFTNVSRSSNCAAYRVRIAQGTLPVTAGGCSTGNPDLTSLAPGGQYCAYYVPAASFVSPALSGSETPGCSAVPGAANYSFGTNPILNFVGNKDLRILPNLPD